MADEVSCVREKKTGELIRYCSQNPWSRLFFTSTRKFHKDEISVEEELKSPVKGGGGGVKRGRHKVEQREVESSTSEVYLRFTALRFSFDSFESASFIEIVFLCVCEKWGRTPVSWIKCEGARFVQSMR